MSDRPRQALLLSAGLGTRLRPRTLTTPKCLIAVKGVPLLGYWLHQVFGSGIERAIVNTHYLPEQVRDYCKASPWADRIDVVHESELLGTAGTLRANVPSLRGHGPKLLAHADNLSVFSPEALYAAHADRPSRCIGTMMTFMTERPRDCGIVEVDDDGIVRAVHEKVANPPGNLANAAVFIIEDAVIDWVVRHPLATDFCRDVVPPLAGKWLTYFNGTFHRDIGTEDALARAEKDYVWTPP